MADVHHHAQLFTAALGPRHKVSQTGFKHGHHPVKHLRLGIVWPLDALRIRHQHHRLMLSLLRVNQRHVSRNITGYLMIWWQSWGLIFTLCRGAPCIFFTLTYVCFGEKSFETLQRLLDSFTAVVHRFSVQEPCFSFSVEPVLDLQTHALNVHHGSDVPGQIWLLLLEINAFIQQKLM